MKHEEGDLRVWHIPQVPMKSFKVKVRTVEEAKLVLNTLWNYDTFQFENKIKPDYSNVSGLEVYKSGEWCEWLNSDDEDIDYIMREEPLPID